MMGEEFAFWSRVEGNWSRVEGKWLRVEGKWSRVEKFFTIIFGMSSSQNFGFTRVSGFCFILLVVSW